MRSLAAHRGWLTRRARAAAKPLALDPPFEGGLYSRAKRERAEGLTRAENARQQLRAEWRAVGDLEAIETAADELVADIGRRLTELLQLLERPVSL